MSPRMIHTPALLVALFSLLLAGLALARDKSTRQGTVNQMTELTFTAGKPHADPFNELQLDLLVTSPDGAQMGVPAFWAGKQTWKARYSSRQAGTHRWRAECSDPSDPGLHGVEGSIELAPYTGDHPLYKHGFIQVTPDHRHLQYADGTPFFWLGDTWWMGLCHRLRFPEDVTKLAEDRKAKGFNVIQIVAGLYPDMHPFDPRGANEAGFPWQEKYARIRPEYFDAADKRMEYLVQEGFTPCIVGAWGYFMPWMGVEKVKQHWRYLIARYGAMPVVWCAAGEANLNWYLDKPFPIDDRKQVTQWTEVMRYIRATDPYHRPLTIHPTGIGRLSARHATDDVSLLDIDMLQTPHGERDAVDSTIKTIQESYADQPVMPVINGEASYEMLMDRIGSRWTRQMFWLCMINGAAGHTYGANGIWQVNRKGQPHGPSPHHPPGSTGYGVIPWDEAMNLPGSTQVGLGKKLFEQYDWQQFKPHPEWASYAGDESANAPAWGKWIWFDEGDPTKNAPVGKRYFRKSFDLPEAEAKGTGTLWLSADDRFAASINGHPVGSHADWKSPQAIDISQHLQSGQNVLTIEAENLPPRAGAPADPAGLIASLRVQTADGKVLTIPSDRTWQASIGPEPAAKWGDAKEIGPYGCAPWGHITPRASYGPFATGSEKVRLVYVPELRSVRITGLERNARYRARTMDAASGKMSELGDVTSDEQSGWTTPAPKQTDGDDWIIILERG
jgi:hypothetical protein